MKANIKSNPSLRLTLVPSSKGGMVHRYVKTEDAAGSSRALPGAPSKIAVAGRNAIYNIEDQKPGWLTEKTGIDIHAYADSERRITNLNDDEQMNVWMKMRTAVRSIESNFAANGLEHAKDFAVRYDDTALALAWERINLSESRDAPGSEFRQAIVDVITSEVMKRIERGEFSPMVTEGYITVAPAPRSSTEF